MSGPGNAYAELEAAVGTGSMAILITVTDESGAPLAELLRGHRRYQLADGTRVWIAEQVAWCPACNQFRLAEELRSRERTEAEDAKFERRMLTDESITPMLREVVSRTRSRLVADRGKWFDYLESERKSPPRCLTCGHDHVAALGNRYGKDKWVDHPAGTGRISLTLVCRVDQREFIIYTPEGLLLNPPDPMPPSTGGSTRCR